MLSKLTPNNTPQIRGKQRMALKVASKWVNGSVPPNNSNRLVQAVIRKCLKKDLDDRPRSEQEWCLYTKDGDRLLGRHPSKEKAESQEKAIQYYKHKAGYSRDIFSSIINDLSKAEKSDKPSVFLGGACDKDNLWRKDIKKEFNEINFIDPYDPDWDPMGNIYDELTGILKVDNVIFYKGGDGTKKEKKFMDSIGKKYKEFDDIEKLKKYLIGIRE